MWILRDCVSIIMITIFPTSSFQHIMSSDFTLFCINKVCITRVVAFSQKKVMVATRTDAGWSWFIFLSAFASYLLWEGTIKSLAVLPPTLKEHFRTHTWMIGLMIALMNAVKDFSGKVYIHQNDLTWNCLTASFFFNNSY